MFRDQFEQYMKEEPETIDQKYIFIVDNSNLALSIFDAGFRAVALEEGKENLFDPESFCEYLTGLEFKGTCRLDYMYVPMCFTKKTNLYLSAFFRVTRQIEGGRNGGLFSQILPA